MDFITVLTRSFFNMVQPNPFPGELIERFVEDYEGALLDEDIIRTLLRYETGFLVCAVIGILYIVLMPVIGGILACCRCHGHRSGRIYQRQASRTNIYRRALYWSVVITTLMILLGNINMFMSHAAFNVSVDQINGTLNSLRTYFTAVPEQLDHMIESYKIADEIDTIGPKLGSLIQKRFKRGMHPAMNLVGMMANLNHSNATNELVNLDGNLTSMEKYKSRFFESVKTAVNDFKEAVGPENECPDDKCKRVINDIIDNLDRMKEETFDFSARAITKGLTNFQSAVEAVKWDSLLQEGENYLKNISQNVTNDTKDVVQAIKNKAEDIKPQIYNLTRPIDSVSTNVVNTLKQLHRIISIISPAVERAEHITRAVGVVLCCMVLLVVACNILGLFLGPLGEDAKADPKDRSDTAHYGGKFLLTSAGFIFLFSWLLMVVVLLLFVPGGNIYSMVCKPWHNGGLLKLIELLTPRLIGFELGPMPGLKINLTLTGVYNDCQKNMSLLSMLHIDELINLEEPLSVSQYTDVILSNVHITPIILLSHVESQINKLHNVTKDLNFTRFTQQVIMIHSIDVGEMIKQINKLGVNGKYLMAGRANLLSAEYFHEDIKNFLGHVNSTTENLRSNVNEINRNVIQVLGIMGTVQGFLNNYTTQIIKTNREFVDRQLGNISHVTYLEWSNLTRQVARCGPVAGAVDSAENIICERVKSLNTFWFSLGLCLIFFIPSIILSIKLAKYYRRMEESDRLKDKTGNYSNHLPDACQLIEIHSY